MGKVIVQKEKAAMCPLMLRQLAKCRNKQNKGKIKNIRPYTSVSTKINVDSKRTTEPAKKRKLSSSDAAGSERKKIKVGETHSDFDRGEPLSAEDSDIVDFAHFEEIREENLGAENNTVGVGAINEKQLLKWPEHSEMDLFWTDEVNNSYEPLKHVNIFFQLIDEICLEGLDGITLEALWTRFTTSFELPVVLHEMAKELLWKLVCYMDFVMLYILEQPRKPLKVYDRYKYMDKSCGVIVEPYTEEENIYPFRPIVDKNIRGSCSTYNERKPAEEEVRKMSYSQVMRMYGSRLVIVADQEMRQHALFYEMADPKIELVDIEYLILERIGRSRKHGELTQGRMSLQELCLWESKTQYHNRKQLTKNRLITKQFFYIRSTQSVTKTGGLVHLKRFYNRRKPKQLMITEQIYNAIKQKPKHRMDIIEFRRRFGYSAVLARLMKSSEFLRFVKTDGVCLYRDLYPDASKSEWKYKSKNDEKTIRVLQILDPSVNVEANWYNEQSSDDDDSSDGEVVSKQTTSADYLRYIYSYIYSKGKEGATVKDLTKHCELDFYTLRMSLKKLTARNVVVQDRVDMGRQRVGRYVSKSFLAKSNEENTGPKPLKLKESILNKIKSNIQKAASAEATQEEHSPQNVPAEPLTSEHLESVIKQSDIICSSLSTRPSRLVEEVSTREEAVFCKYNCHKIMPSLRCIALHGITQNISCDIKFSLEMDSAVPHTINLKTESIEICVESRKHDPLMKVMLIKLLLDEVPSDLTPQDFLTTLTKSFGRTEDEDVDVKTTSVWVEKSEPAQTSSNNTDKLLGDNISIVFDEASEHDIHTQILTSSEVVDIVPPGTPFTDAKNRGLTERVIARANIILDIVNSEKVFEVYTKFLKIIADKEYTNGYKKTIDRRSLRNIIILLKNDGYIKIYKLVMTHKGVERFQYFLCSPNVPHDHSLITASREQLKMKFFVSAATVSKATEVKQESSSPSKDTISASCKEYSTMVSPKLPPQYTFDRKQSRMYGYKPKFLRMQILHELLYFLVYNHEPTMNLTDDDTLKLLRAHQLDSDDTVMKHLPKLYSKEVNWNMFVPPLPKHKGWDEGWTLVCDVLMRLPLSIFIKLHSVQYVVPELESFLNHPIKRHFLVRYLPSNIQNVLLYNRKHMYSLHETLTRLCYIGLLQFGPQKFREKDQVFIYINRRASLLDTTTSKPFYNMVTDKVYKKMEFHFRSHKTVESYWWNLWSISMATPLGKRQSGECIIIEDPTIKPQLIESLKPREPKMAEKFDTGCIPGDQRGAAGIDSSLWVHLKRNWLWATHSTTIYGTNNLEGTEMRQYELDQIQPQAINFASLLEDSVKPKIFLHNQSQHKKEQKKTHHKTEAPPKKSVKTRELGGIVKKKKRKEKKVIRRVQHHKKALRQYYDSLDKMIIRQNGARFKTSFNPNERMILRTMKAASSYLVQDPKKHSITIIVLRDVLHCLSPVSKDKTSRAVQRRIISFLKSQKETRAIEYLIETISNMSICKKYFSKLRVSPLKDQVSDNELCVAFVYLMAYLKDKINQISHTLHGRAGTVDYFAPQNVARYKPKLVYLEQPPAVMYQKPNSVDDIKLDVVRSVVHSSLSCHRNEISWSYQVFRVYQKYPDTVIRKAIVWLKRQQILSYRKKFSMKKEQLSHVPYQLSNLYIYMQSSTFTQDTAIEAFKRLVNLYQSSDPASNNVSSVVASDKRYGTMLGLNELASIVDDYDLMFEIPDMALVLNPEIDDHSEVLRELAMRYQLRLQDKFEEDDINEEQNMFNEEEEETPILENTAASNEDQDKQVHSTSADNVPSVDEIIAGMLDANAPKPRKIPHYSDLQQLLSREKFPGLNLDDEKLDRLKSHFITCVPHLQEFNLTNVEELKNNCTVDFILKKESNNMMETAIRHYIIGEPMVDKLEEMVRKSGGDDSDLKLSEEIINFVSEKQHLGAAASEIKEKFEPRTCNMKLHHLINILTRTNILLRTGVTSFVFVYYKCRSVWLVETFLLSESEKEELQASSKVDRDGLKEKISKRIKPNDEFLVQIAPWTKVDGTFNKQLLSKWLTTILSYCLENPGTEVKKLFVRFCYLKPLDVYQILEFLEEIGAVKIYVYEKAEVSLFSETKLISKRPATYLDDFDDMFVCVHNMSMICLGSALIASNT